MNVELDWPADIVEQIADMTRSRDYINLGRR